MSDRQSSITTWAQIIATASIGLAGLLFTVQQEQSRKTQSAVQIMSERERAEIDFREKIFETMIPKLLDEKATVRQRLTILQLFQHNFHDLFNGRAIFDVLTKDAEREYGKYSEKHREFMHDLVSLAKEITENQEQLIGGDVDVRTVLQGRYVDDTLRFADDGHGDHKDIDGHSVRLFLLGISENEVEVQASISGHTDLIDRKFKVSYFDAPLTDNMLLRDEHRFAITLKDIDTLEHKATFQFLHFPAHYITTGYRPSIERVNRMLEH